MNEPVRHSRRWQTLSRGHIKFICLGYYEPAKHAAMTEAERNAMFDECFHYDDQLRADGHYLGGDALQPRETALTVAWNDGKVTTTDGPFAESKEHLGGILVLEAEDMNQAVQLMSQHPAVRYGSIFEIRPIFDMSEMIRASDVRRHKTTAR